MTTLKMYKVHPDVRLPKHQTTGSACFDLSFDGSGKGVIHVYTKNNKPVTRTYSGSLTISPGDRALVPTGIIMDIPEGYSVRLHARSGTSLKQGIILGNGEGVIDSDYIDEVFVILHNVSENSITINNGDRVAQAELVKNLEYTIEQTPARPMPKTNRIGGFGSTGIINKNDTVIINIPQIPLIKETVDNSVKRGRGRPRKNA